MTAKNIKRSSIVGDRYYTPRWAVRQFIRRVLPVVCDQEVLETGTFLEPCAGSGNIVRELRKAFPRSTIDAIDLNGEYDPWRGADTSRTADFLKLNWGSTLYRHRYDVVATNPPYTLALEFCERSIELADVTCMLVRLGFLASQRRYKFYKRRPPSHVFVLTKRPSFVYGQTDTADYCWVCWSKFHEGPTEFRWLPLPKEKK